MAEDSDFVSGMKEVAKVGGTLVVGLLAVGGIIVAINVAKQKEEAPKIDTTLTAEVIGDCLYPEPPYKVKITNTGSKQIDRWVVNLRVQDRGHSTRYEGANVFSDFILAPKVSHITCIGFGDTGMVFSRDGLIKPLGDILDPVVTAHARDDYRP